MKTKRASNYSNEIPNAWTIQLNPNIRTKLTTLQIKLPNASFVRTSNCLQDASFHITSFSIDSHVFWQQAWESFFTFCVERKGQKGLHFSASMWDDYRALLEVTTRTKSNLNPRSLKLLFKGNLKDSVGALTCNKFMVTALITLRFEGGFTKQKNFDFQGRKYLLFYLARAKSRISLLIKEVLWKVKRKLLLRKSCHERSNRWPTCMTKKMGVMWT